MIKKQTVQVCLLAALLFASAGPLFSQTESNVSIAWQSDSALVEGQTKAGIQITGLSTSDFDMIQGVGIETDKSKKLFELFLGTNGTPLLG